MKKFSTKVNRLQLEVIGKWLGNFISYSQAPQADVAFKLHCAVLGEIKQDVDIKLADNYRHNFKLHWTPAKALAFHLMVLYHSAEELMESYEGVSIMRISNEIDQRFA